jgi:hypothetical protein
LTREIETIRLASWTTIATVPTDVGNDCIAADPFRLSFSIQIGSGSAGAKYFLRDP